VVSTSLRTKKQIARYLKDFDEQDLRQNLQKHQYQQGLCQV